MLPASQHSITVTLSQLLSTVPNLTAEPLTDILANDPETWAKIKDISFASFVLDSRNLAPNDVFVLLKSHSNNKTKSADYLRQAATTAAMILTEIDPKTLLAKDELESLSLSCPVIFVPHIRQILGSLIQLNLQANLPQVLPTVVAVTGTNGKTTISQLVAQLSELAGKSSAVMGTAGNGRLNHLVQASHTTGDASLVQQFLYQLGQEGAAVLALEASSHGLDQLRLQGVPISTAIFTNLSRDHLDYHASMEEYAAAKARLFDKTYFPTLTHAIINLDDDFAALMIQTAQKSDLEVWTYSLNPTAKATFVATNIAPSLDGVTIEIQSPFGKSQVTSPLLGRFNVANLIAAMAAVATLGVDFNELQALVPKLHSAMGRMQRVLSNEGCFIVDYAHTPDALTQVLTSLKAHCSGTLWAVFGCGGDRDRGKRPLMAQAGLAAADRVVLTSDNPRSEDPKQILADMQAGLTSAQLANVKIEPNRKAAIDWVVSQACADDIVVIAGKGHEMYQEIKGVRYDFDDSQVLADALTIHQNRAFSASPN